MILFRNLTFKQHISQHFTCNFDFDLFPFDTQKCRIEFLIPPEYKKSVELWINQNEPEFLGEESVNQYVLDEFKFLELTNEKDKVVVQFTLRRQLVNVFLTFLIPTMLINLVGFLLNSHFIPHCVLMSSCMIQTITV